MKFFFNYNIFKTQAESCISYFVSFQATVTCLKPTVFPKEAKQFCTFHPNWAVVYLKYSPVSLL